VRGDANEISLGATGVIGNQFNLNGGGGRVLGQTFGSGSFTYGIRGESFATSGVGVGLMGITWSPRGDGGRFVGVKGTSGTILRGDTRPPGAEVQVKGAADHYAAGDLLVMDPSGERRLSTSQTPYSTLVAGIFSTQPGVVASQHRAGEALPSNEVPWAVVGIVPCKVSAENGPVEVGDLLVASAPPGYAMKGTDRSKMLVS
jgi:hypothetical protein